MSTSYRVIDLRDQQEEAHIVETAKSPEDAARVALGLDLVRSGVRKELIAKVYWQQSESQPKNVVRLYNKVPDRPRR